MLDKKIYIKLMALAGTTHGMVPAGSGFEVHAPAPSLNDAPASGSQAPLQRFGSQSAGPLSEPLVAPAGTTPAVDAHSDAAAQALQRLRSRNAGPLSGMALDTTPAVPPGGAAAQPPQRLRSQSAGPSSVAPSGTAHDMRTAGSAVHDERLSSMEIRLGDLETRFEEGFHSVREDIGRMAEMFARIHANMSTPSPEAMPSPDGRLSDPRPALSRAPGAAGSGAAAAAGAAAPEARAADPWAANPWAANPWAAGPAAAAAPEAAAGPEEEARRVLSLLINPKGWFDQRFEGLNNAGHMRKIIELSPEEISPEEIAEIPSLVRGKKNFYIKFLPLFSQYIIHNISEYGRFALSFIPENEALARIPLNMKDEVRLNAIYTCARTMVSSLKIKYIFEKLKLNAQCRILARTSNSDALGRDTIDNIDNIVKLKQAITNYELDLAFLTTTLSTPDSFRDFICTTLSISNPPDIRRVTDKYTNFTRYLSPSHPVPTEIKFEFTEQLEIDLVNTMKSLLETFYLDYSQTF